jgi:hypothetical protein
MDNPAASDTGFDLDSSVATIASGLGLDIPEPEDAEAPASVEAPESEAPEQTAAAPAPRQPPKSWAKEKHELWSKLPADAQDYYELREKQMLDGIEQYKGDAGYAKQLRDVISPYKAVLASQGVSETEAVQYLLNAHYRLTQGTPEERAAAYRQIGVDLGLEQADETAPLDPALKQLQQELHQVKSTLTAQQQAEYNKHKAQADAETNTFASDPANLYFNEVAQDMLPFVKAGASLKDAYDKAVWANPITREKEIARRQTDDAAKLKERTKNEAETARKAMNTNVRGAQTQKAPTDPKGSMEDTMRDTLKKIKDRAH